MTHFNEKDWLAYRATHPELRYWQALRNYMGVGYIMLADTDNEIPDRETLTDTFYIGDNSTIDKTT
jgi:hypothetical protein